MGRRSTAAQRSYPMFGDSPFSTCQVYATGDANGGWRWASPSTVSGAGLAAYAAATGFATKSLSPVDDPDGYFASATKVVGLQVQNTAAITSATAGTLTIYIVSLAVSTP